MQYAVDEASPYPMTLSGGKTYAGCMQAHAHAPLRNDGKCRFVGEWEPTLQTHYKQAYVWTYDRLEGRIPPSWWQPYVPEYPTKTRRFFTAPLILPSEGPLPKEWHSTESPKLSNRSRKK
jgi:hypothetical protein